ncbi:MAG: phosphatidate cytidylyltransferase [Pseudomonadota bacterium]|nr:phosphatidate cytidylyltransferase [Pseudomonadota bacterium]
MLKQRLLTIAVLLPIFLAALFLMDTLSFALFLLVILVLSLFEWANLSAIKAPFTRVAYIAVGVAIVVTVQYYELAGRPLFILVFVIWLLVIVRLFRFGNKNSASQSPSGNGPLAWLDGYFVLLPTILGLQILKAQDSAAPQLLLVFFFIIWSADTGAYLAGRSLGKHKLAPRISPGKTVEGLIGGLAGALLIAAMVGVLIWELPADKLIYWLIAVVFITLLSVTGDLFESIYKRRAGVKDSGKLLPGHGGVLDRIDSACAALPPYMLVLYQFDLLAAGVSV